MTNPANLSREELLELVDQQAVTLVANHEQLASTNEQLASTNEQLASTNEQLATTNEQLASTARQLLISQDTIKQLEAKIEQKEKEYLKLWRERFAARSERYIADPDQLRIDFGDTAESADAAAGLKEAVEEAQLIPAHHRRKARKTSHALPESLPRQEEIVEPEAAAKECETHGPKQLLPESMWDVTEKLVYVPGHCYVLRRKYAKYACGGNPGCGIASAERPTGIVEGDKYDTSVAAQLITYKYAYHMPLYRQQDMFAGTGWLPSRSVMVNILLRCKFILQPLLDYMKRLLRNDRNVSCDDTGITLLYPKIPPEFDPNDPKEKRVAEVYAEALKEQKPSINAKMWVYRGVSVPLNVFDFTVSRHRDGPEWFFQDYSGTILGDCWHGFDAIALSSGGRILRAACNAHARRKFEDLTDYPEDRKRWLVWYQQLFDLESQCQERGLSGEELLTERRALARPVWNQMRAELESISERTEQVVLPKSDLRKALNYMSNHWVELMRYLDDPGLAMDNNETEQLMRQVALGRKNWMFCGSLDGGERAAGFLTLVSSAHRSNLDVWAYVNDVLKRLLRGETNYDPLLPWNWGAANPTQINTFRQQERSDRQAQKRAHRQLRRARQKRLATHLANKNH